MHTARRLLGVLSLLVVIFVLALPALGAEKARIKAQDYVIDAEILPRPITLIAHARSSFWPWTT